MTMDTDSLFDHAKSRFNHVSARRILKEKYEARMLFAYGGGMFKAGPELLTLLQACPPGDDLVIADLYNNPIKVRSKELYDLALLRWQEQMNAWLCEFTEIKRQR